VPVPDYRHQPGPARHPVPQGYEQFRISWIAPDNPRKSGGRDHARVSLADLPATRPGAVRPHPALHGHYAFFRIVSLSWRAPLRNRTVDLLLTIGARSASRPGTSAEGQVRRSTSAQLGAVRDCSRQMRPPKFLPAVCGGGAMSDLSFTQPDLCSICCDRHGEGTEAQR
jgi:hypothetical protein